MYNMVGSSLFKIPANSIRRFCSAAVSIKSKDEIDRLVKAGKVVVFMKGTPQEPMCGFSRLVAQILRMHDVPYQHHNVLEDQGIREGVKKYSDWPTIPQVFIDGQFVGGADITLQMHQSGDLIELLKKSGIKSALAENASEKK